MIVSMLSVIQPFSLFLLKKNIIEVFTNTVEI